MDRMQSQTGNTPGNTSVEETLENIFSEKPDAMQICIQNCVQCHQICEQMIQYCLGKGGPHAAPEHIRLLQDCAQICGVSADFMIRGSDLHPRACGVCAEACETCATDCAKFTDDELMLMCADACWRCAETCQKMANQH